MRKKVEEEPEYFIQYQDRISFSRDTLFMFKRIFQEKQLKAWHKNTPNLFENVLSDAIKDEVQKRIDTHQLLASQLNIPDLARLIVGYLTSADYVADLKLETSSLLPNSFFPPEKNGAITDFYIKPSEHTCTIGLGKIPASSATAVKFFFNRIIPGSTRALDAQPDEKIQPALAPTVNLRIDAQVLVQPAVLKAVKEKLEKYPSQTLEEYRTKQKNR